MLFLRSLISAKPHPRVPASGLALTIGSFDGVHVGHQALIKTVTEGARDKGLMPAVMTFEPHPREVFRPDEAPPRVQLLRDKAAALAAQGVAALVIAPFKPLRHLSAEAFVRDILLARLRTRLLVVGDDFHFGKGREGNVALLRRLANEGSFVLQQIESVSREGHRVSSSNLRHALRHADFARTAYLMGRGYAMSGHVVHGQQLGRTLGFPTLNLRIAHDRPALSGIFCVWVRGLDDDRQAAPRAGLASLGRRPTIHTRAEALLEVFVLDWPGALEHAYGRLVCVEFVHKIRDEARFSGLPELTEAMRQDEMHARAYFATLATRAGALAPSASSA